MALTTYTELLAAVASWLDRTDLAASIPDFVRLGEQRIQRDLHLRFLDIEFDGAMVAGQDFITLPVDCAWPKLLRINLSPERYVRIVALPEFTDLRFDSQAESPLVGCNFGLTLKLAPTPTTNLAYTLFYSSGMPLLVASSNETNWLTANGMDVLLYAALSESGPFIGNDERTGGWEQNYASRIGGLRQQEWRARTGGGTLAVRPGTPVA